ncbi:MAG: site-2 protease family protein [Alphaproteobacteria bacterium]|nr:site-2 protease family protein [Alphaproteobacteria bacterium]
MSDFWFIASAWAIPVLLAITLHEAAHGYAALRYGDDTAQRAGRISLNPLRHIHPVGTVLMPGLLLLAGLPAFGFARPVPVNFMALNDPKRDMVWVAAAGPGANVLMAVTAGLLLNALPLFEGTVQQWVGTALFAAIQVNVLLAFFNMLPVPPLDGGRVAVGLLPDSLARRWARIEQFGVLIVFGLILIPFMLSDLFNLDVNVLAWVLIPVVDFFTSAIAGAFWFNG